MTKHPDEFIPTRGSLLSRLKDWDDQDSWRDFFNTYWKLIYGVALKAGLTETDAQEVVQETVISVAKAIPQFKYDAAVCSFKTWLQLLIRRRIADQFRKRRPDHSPQQRHPEDTSRTATIDCVPDPAGIVLDAVWDEEWRKNLVDAALERIKEKINPKHYQIFYLSVLKQMSVLEVARSLRVNAGQVYLVKHRVSALVKKEVKRLETKIVVARPRREP